MDRIDQLILACTVTLMFLVVGLSCTHHGKLTAEKNIMEQCRSQGYAVTLDGWAFECRELGLVVDDRLYEPGVSTRILTKR